MTIRLVGAGVLALLVLLGPGVGYADWGDRYDPDAVQKRFSINLGAFAKTRMETSIRFDSDTVPIGTVIDMEDRLGIDSRETVGRIDGLYRFNAQHRLGFTYYTSNRSGSQMIGREIIIGDPNDGDGIDIIPVGGFVDTDYKYDFFRLGYSWSFLNKERYEWFIGGGLSVRSLDFDLRIQSEGLLGLVDTDERRLSQGVPLPTIATGGRWGITPKLNFLFRYELFYVELGDYQGSQEDVLFLLEHETFKHVGFGGGFNAVSLDLRADASDARGQLDSLEAGFLVYLKAYF